MQQLAAASQEPSLGWPRAELQEPPGLSPEQAWAWALDHFEALCRHSCPSCAEAHSHEGQPPSWPEPWPEESGARNATETHGTPTP